MQQNTQNRLAVPSALLSAALLSGSALYAGDAAAAEYRVGSSDTADFDTIEAAIAVALDGDFIAIEAGNYGDLIVEGGIQLTVAPMADRESIRLRSVKVMDARTELTLDGVTIADGPFGIEVIEGSAALHNVDIANTGSAEGGFAAAVRQDGALTITGSTVSNSQGQHGVVIAESGATLALTAVVIDGCQAEIGGALYVRDATANLDEVRMTGNRATSGGAIAVVSGTLAATNLRIDENEALRGGGAWFGPDAVITIEDLSMRANSATDGAHIYTNGAAVSIVRSKLTAGMAERGGAITLLDGSLQATNANWSFQELAEVGGAVFMEGGELTVRYGVIYGNPAEVGGGIAMEGGDAVLAGVIFAKNQAEVIANSGDGKVTLAQILVWDNEGNDGLVGNILGGTDVRNADPRFMSPQMGDFALRTDSPALDLGLRNESDPDGTASDLGMYGGPDAWALADDDGDGYVYGRDCDEGDASINEGAVDEWYDAIDANCDLVDDFDQDLDGYRAAEFGGEDCDDTDRYVHPDQKESSGDHLDLDCDGLAEPDADGDGWPSTLDCDDDDEAVRPDAPEVWYDGVDANCDGADDFDQDGDGWMIEALGGLDCDDEDPFVNPDAVELSGNGRDDNCDGLLMERETPQEAEETEAPTTSPEQAVAYGERDRWEARTSCSATPTAAPFWMGALMALGLLARRRER